MVSKNLYIKINNKFKLVQFNMESLEREYDSYYLVDWISQCKNTCLRFESLHKQDRSCLAWMILVDQISQGKNTYLRFESLYKQDWSCRAWMILHAT